MDKEKLRRSWKCLKLYLFEFMSVCMSMYHLKYVSQCYNLACTDALIIKDNEV